MYGIIDEISFFWIFKQDSGEFIFFYTGFFIVDIFTKFFFYLIEYFRIIIKDYIFCDFICP